MILLKNVIAVSGTAFTNEQIKLIKRYTNNIAIAFDADNAGQEAAKRSIGLAIEEGLNVKVINIPEGAGKDADECIKNNPQVWLRAVADAQSVMDWYFAKTLARYDRNDPKQKQAAAEILLTEILRIPYAVEKDDWIKKLSNELDIELSVLREVSHKIALGAKKEKNSAAPIQRLARR